MPAWWHRMKNRRVTGERHTRHDALRLHRARATAYERLQIDAVCRVDRIRTHTINHHKHNHCNTSVWCAVALQVSTEEAFDE